MQIFPNQQQQDFGWDKVSVVGILLWSLSTFLRCFSKIFSKAVAVGKQKCQILTTDSCFDFPKSALNFAVAQLLTGIFFGGEDNISIILCILLFGMPVTTDALLPSLLHLKLLLVCIRAAKLCWSTAGAQPDALAADPSLNQCPAGRHTITVVCEAIRMQVTM